MFSVINNISRIFFKHLPSCKRFKNCLLRIQAEYSPGSSLTSCNRTISTVYNFHREPSGYSQLHSAFNDCKFPIRKVKISPCNPVLISTFINIVLPTVFELFFRVEKSRATTYGGSGLGLTIVKQLVELHHDTIQVTSSAEGTTWFTIDFPLTLSLS
jgi:hypothetical protein